MLQLFYPAWLKPGTAETAGTRRWVPGMAWAERHPASATKAILSSKVLRLAYQILNRALVLKGLSLKEHPIMLHN